MKIDHEEIECKNVKWVLLVQRGTNGGLLNRINVWILLKVGHFLCILMAVAF